MKVNKDGTPRLEKGEIRIGNFFIKREKGHVKVQDISSLFSLRVDTRMPLGIWLENMLGQGDGGAESIKAYVAVMWSLLSAAPDNGLVDDILRAAQEALARHPDWYGAPKDAPTEKEDEEALEEQRDLSEFVEQVKEMGHGDEG